MELYGKFQNMRKHQARDQHKLQPFNDDMEKLFDIYCKDDKSRKAKEKASKVTMGTKEFKTLNTT